MRTGIPGLPGLGRVGVWRAAGPITGDRVAVVGVGLFAAGPIAALVFPCGQREAGA